MITAGLIGYGYWGPNLLRNLQASGRFEVRAIAEPESERLELARRAAPGASGCADARELIERGDIAAVLIATPVATHHALARQAIEHGKHVLIEKPMCRSARQCEELIAFAA
ncbi:MAG TPA: Gfo/Idh/MocA family oxidoreductase, partial [Burkholderiales bacterium]|nr:Gfo/Idh/MocA family oxidoreductase [Burkholderiales bacterium]